MILAALALACLQAEQDKSLLVVLLDDVGAEHLEFTPQGQVGVAAGDGGGAG